MNYTSNPPLSFFSISSLAWLGQVLFCYCSVLAHARETSIELTYHIMRDSDLLAICGCNNLTIKHWIRKLKSGPTLFVKIIFSPTGVNSYLLKLQAWCELVLLYFNTMIWFVLNMFWPYIFGIYIGFIILYGKTAKPIILNCYMRPSCTMRSREEVCVWGANKNDIAFILCIISKCSNYS